MTAEFVPSPRRAALLRLAAGVILALALAAPGRAALTLTELYEFNAASPPNSLPPGGALIQARDDNFYGTIFGDGRHPGTIFRLNPDGTITTLHTFAAATEGDGPTALLQAADGDFYGTTSAGGPGGGGSVFRITPDGVFTTLYLFARSESRAFATTLTQGRDGNFYGTTTTSASGGNAIIFRLTPDGTLTTLHVFPDISSLNSSGFHTSLAEADDGSLYGATDGSFEDYPDVLGSLFRLAPDGTFTTLHSFQGNGDGGGPSAFFRGNDGNFYGATGGGGFGIGSIFRITPGGDFTALRLFPGSDGPPLRALIQGGDGNFYGVRSEVFSPPFYAGSVFRFALDGTLATLRDFDFASTYEPRTLLQAADGAFYGTTDAGGASGDGAVFRLADEPDTVLPVVRASLGGVHAVKIEYSETPGRLRLTLSSPPSADLKVLYAVGGDARPGVDYLPLKGRVTVRAGQTTRVIRVNARPYVSGPARKVLKLRLLPGEGYTLGAAAGPFKFLLLRPQ